MTGKKFGLAYGAVLAAFTAYVLLDTFVLPTKYSSVESTQTISDYSQTETVNDETVITSPKESAVSSEAQDYTSKYTQSSEENSDTGTTSSVEEVTQSTEITENSYSDGNITVTLTEYY